MIQENNSLAAEKYFLISVLFWCVSISTEWMQLHKYSIAASFIAAIQRSVLMFRIQPCILHFQSMAATRGQTETPAAAPVPFVSMIQSGIILPVFIQLG